MISGYPAYSQTPIAVAKITSSTGLPAFSDDDSGLLGQKFAARLVKRGLLGKAAQAQVAAHITTLSIENPRTIKRSFHHRLGPVDTMKAFRDMPDDLAKAFSDGKEAVLTSRALVDTLRSIEKLPVFAGVFANHVSEAQKLQYAQISLPKAAADLPNLMAEAFAKIGVSAVCESGKEYNFVHITFVGKNPVTRFTTMSQHIDPNYPFTRGGTPIMLSPTAWAILKGLGMHVFGELAVESGNAAKPARPSTATLRRLARSWTEAMDTYKRYRGYEPPRGYSDKPAVPFAPPPQVMDEIRAYAQKTRPSSWRDGITAGIPKMIEFCVNAKRKRTWAEHEKLLRQQAK